MIHHRIRNKNQKYTALTLLFEHFWKTLTTLLCYIYIHTHIFFINSIEIAEFNFFFHSLAKMSYRQFR